MSFMKDLSWAVDTCFERRKYDPSDDIKLQNNIPLSHCI